ncbi:hypothetical protein Q8W71_26255 [Methylobacterium sp. NEAU 140]|uniref:hypothetical protein n=1 Tax=Methylobacterium sp. NEAU 140 TaxID=3064945 RepID=UPI00273417C9|nr:hypothetical protein [Methylobacterium sp. NEAU 140]MDP4026133.1 hypothetical protein [Methylobacterium sp. NEAU 140]
MAVRLRASPQDRTVTRPGRRIAGRVLVITIALASATSPPADATEMADLLGVWEQVASNAGPCPACTIAFRETLGGVVDVAKKRLVRGPAGPGHRRPGQRVWLLAGRARRGLGRGATVHDPLPAG